MIYDRVNQPKKFQDSKKKRRNKEFKEREAKRLKRKKDQILDQNAMESGNIEEMAKVMGVKLQ